MPAYAQYERDLPQAGACPMSDRLNQWAARWQIPAAALVELLDMDTVEATAAAVGEAKVVRDCRLEADQLGGVLWRNNSGATFDVHKRMIRYGLGNDSIKLNRDYKSPDLVGIAPGGRFWSAECKVPGWTHPVNERDRAQANFGRHVVALGGLFTFATDPAHIRQMIGR
jgi:hypothetical protein